MEDDHFNDVEVTSCSSNSSSDFGPSNITLESLLNDFQRVQNHHVLLR
ncbi:unnamed protein product, partial [Cuscuta europaea]